MLSRSLNPYCVYGTCPNVRTLQCVLFVKEGEMAILWLPERNKNVAKTGKN